MNEKRIGFIRGAVSGAGLAGQRRNTNRNTNKQKTEKKKTLNEK